MKNKTILKSIAVLTASFSLTGCLSRSGTYAGYVSELRGAQNTQHPVQIQVGDPSGHGIQCTVSEVGSPEVLSTSFDMSLHGNTVTVTDLSHSINELTLTKDKNSDCWRSVSPKAFACLDSTGFQFQLELTADHQIHFWTDKGAEIPRAPAVTSVHTFSVERLQQLSVRGNFNNRMEFENVIQAKKQADIAFRSLGPRLSFNGMVTAVTGGLMAFATGSISELAPFLFPANWYAAKQQERTAKAAVTAARLFKIDTAVQVEITAAAISRDQAILDAYQRLLNETAPIREQISVRERLGQYPAGSTDNVDSILSQARQDILTVQQSVGEEERSLAMMVGLGDLNSVHAIDWSKDSNPVTHPLSLNRSTMLESAVSRSLEILQVQTLIEAGEMKVKQSAWSWLDPSGAPTTGIGLANGAGIDLSKSQLRELQVQSQMIDALIRQKMLDAAQALETATRSYSVTQSTFAIQEARKNQIFNQIRLGLTIDFFGLVQVLQDDLKTQVDVQNSIAAYRSSKAAANRTLLQGIYADIE